MQKKRASGSGIAEDFVTLPRKRDTPPSGADFRPHRSDRLPQCDETLPLACHLKTAVRLIFPRL